MSSNSVRFVTNGACTSKRGSACYGACAPGGISPRASGADVPLEWVDEIECWPKDKGVGMPNEAEMRSLFDTRTALFRDLGGQVLDEIEIVQWAERFALLAPR